MLIFIFLNKYFIKNVIILQYIIFYIAMRAIPVWKMRSTAFWALY